MSILKLMRDRQMYKYGQRVAKTLDGSRPGYRGSDYGDQAKGTGAYSGGTTGGANFNASNMGVLLTTKVVIYKHIITTCNRSGR
jgi:hypothetical protein